MAKQRILICGDRGMVGSALVRRFRGPAVEIIGANRAVVDLTRQAAVEEFIGDCRPNVIIVAAAKVGGIHANSHQPVPFLYDNLAIETHIIQAAHQADVDRLLFLGSSCMYPRAAAQPIVESALLSGPLEPTNQWYALAKIAGAMLCQAYRAQYGRRYISAIPTNLFGPGDNFHPENSHVPAALM
ncbi:MAG: NAD-dependent epimerase/dehydratase family protein, partial [Pseudomonadota bacterium]|nr:NAD-dependent epimerase/dehydratase family protein [Pseudomonadota bacterium]